MGKNNTKNGENLLCPVCGSIFYRKKSRIEKAKNKDNMTCSRECCYILRKELYKGENNHQYGLKGELNSSFKTGINESSNYVMVMNWEHPFCDVNGCVPRYRLVADEFLLNDNNYITHNGIKYLKKECVVHHIDMNKKNDAVSNLYIFDNETKHLIFHNLLYDKFNSLEEFEVFYRKNYIEKIFNFEWMKMAYVDLDLSVNKISEMLSLSYNALSKSVNDFNLKPLLEIKLKREEDTIMRRLQNNKIRGFEVVKDACEVIQLPTRSDSRSAGYDFYSPIKVSIKPNEQALIWTNVKSYMLEDEVLEIHVRSSIGIKKGLTLANTTGIIDSSYYSNPSNDGNIGICLKNNSSTVVDIERGDRIAQGLFKKYLVADNDCTLGDGRAGGIGSSGK